MKVKLAEAFTKRMIHFPAMKIHKEIYVKLKFILEQGSPENFRLIILRLTAPRITLL